MVTMRRASDSVHHRRWRLLELLEEHHQITVEQALADPRIGHVSKPTIYSDFNEIVALGLADRVPGGLRSRVRPAWAGTYFGRNYDSLLSEIMGGERRILAHYFAENFLSSYCSCIFGHGTSCLAAAEAAVHRWPGITVVSSNLAIAQLLPRDATVVIGGTVEPEVAATGGSIAKQNLIQWSETHAVDAVVLSTSGLAARSDDDGTPAYLLTCRWLPEADVQSQMFSIGLQDEARLVLLIGQKKLGKQDIYEFGRLTRLPRNASLKPKVSILTTKIGADKARSKWLDTLKRDIEEHLGYVELIFVPEKPLPT
jgi:DeoR/GlpR family transcriptional regulator of sugar metabolism